MDGNAVFHTMTHSQLVQMQEGQYLEVWVKARSAAATVYIHKVGVFLREYI